MMKKTSVLAVLLIALLCATVAHAQQLTASPATTYTNGVAIPSGTPTTFTFYSDSSASGSSPTAIATCTNLSTPSCTPPQVGTVAYYSVTETINGSTSAQSNVATFTPTPNAPSLTTPVVANANMAPVIQYRYNASLGKKTYVGVVGFVPVGVQCSGPTLLQYRGMSYQSVPASSVLAWDDALPAQIAAPCAVPRS